MGVGPSLTQGNSALGTSSSAPAPTTNTPMQGQYGFFSGLPAYAQGFNPYTQPFMSQFAPQQQGPQGGYGGPPPWMQGQQGGYGGYGGPPPWMQGQQGGYGGYGGPPPWMQGQQGGYGGWGHHDWDQNQNQNQQQQSTQTQSLQQANAPANPNSTTFTP